MPNPVLQGYVILRDVAVKTAEYNAQLLVIMMRNSTDRFRLQVATKRFLDVVEKVVKGKGTAPEAKTMLLKSMSVLAYEHKVSAFTSPPMDL